MNCLVCGHKLAIFRKLSLGDFCCQEHRALFLKDQSELGLARLVENSSEQKNRENRISGATRVYAQFLHEEVPASVEVAVTVAHGPLAAPRVMIAAEQSRHCCAQLAPAIAMPCSKPAAGVTAPIYFEAAAVSLRLPESYLPVSNVCGWTRLRRAGLILPWSGETGPHTTFSLAPLVAAAWANSGYSRPINPQPFPVGAIQFVWPGIEGKLEIPVRAREMSMAAFAAMEASPYQVGRVRLDNPSAAKSSPKLELSLAAPARIEEEPAPAGAVS